MIRSKIETGHFDVYEVCAEMGHSSVKVTEGYVQQAKYFYKKEPYDWFKRVLKFHHDDGRGKHVKIAKTKKTEDSDFNPSEKKCRCHPTTDRVLLGVFVSLSKISSS